MVFSLVCYHPTPAVARCPCPEDYSDDDYVLFKKEKGKGEEEARFPSARVGNSEGVKAVLCSLGCPALPCPALLCSVSCFVLVSPAYGGIVCGVYMSFLVLAFDLSSFLITEGGNPLHSTVGRWGKMFPSRICHRYCHTMPCHAIHCHNPPTRSPLQRSNLDLFSLP